MKFTRVRLKPEEERPEFDCGDDDLNEFFHTDSKKACEKLIAVTYLFHNEKNKPVAYYCVSNDAITQALTSKTMWKRLLKITGKKYKSMPAVKIGRFAVAGSVQKSGLGTQLMSAIKYDFTNGNKTGCRYIIVDAYRESVEFYLKNGFKFLIGDGNDKNAETFLMFYDLIQYVLEPQKED